MTKGNGGRNDLSSYSVRRVRFLLAHREAYDTAYLNPSGAAASHELARLEREYQTLPPRHAGWCPGECPSERCGLPESVCARRGHFHSPCLECRRLRQSVQYRDIGISPGGGYSPGPRTPSPAMLDLERAIEVIGGTDRPADLARYMSLNGTSLARPGRHRGAVQLTPIASDAAAVAALPSVVVPCQCLGYCLGGAAYCAHQPAFSVDR